MNIKSLAIYGSTARGERSSNSDVDCFAIYDESYYKMVVKGSVNIAFYPVSLAEKIMKEGSIFALHINKEAVPYFNEQLFSEVVSLFQYKAHYNYEIDTASKLLQFILKYEKKIKNKSLMNKRISWCVRTILISMSAMKREPIFSKDKLSQVFSNNLILEKELMQLIALKSSHVSEKKDLELVGKFLNAYSQEILSENNDKFLTKSMSRLISGSSVIGY